MKRTIVIILITTLSQVAMAQVNQPQFTLPLAVAVPINQFAEADEGRQAYFGLGGELNFPIFNESPVRAGISFRYFFMGNRNRDVEITDSIGTFDVFTKVHGGMMPLHAFLRFDMMNIYDYPVLPFASGFVGPRFFTITRKEEIDYRDGEDPIVDYNRSAQTTLSFGFDLGVHIRVHDLVLIQIKWERAYGSFAEYLDVSSIEIDDEGFASYEVLETRTDIDVFTLGVTIQLDKNSFNQ